MTDYYAQGYTGNRLPPNRYKVEASVTLTTNQGGPGQGGHGA